MRTEIKRMLSGRNFWAAVFLGALGIGFGAVYPKLGEELLPAWNFLSMEKKAFYSETACFFVPLAAVLPWSDSFLGEWKGGFLKAVLPRTGRLDYVGNKVVAVALSGFLAWLLAGVLISFGYFVLFFPMEHQGNFPVEEGREFLYILLRLGLLGGILSTLGGAAAAVYRSVYLAWGLPFVAYYFCMILHDRYFAQAFWLYPPQWIEGNGDWGEGKLGLWLFLLMFLLGAMAVHGMALYRRVEEI